MMTYYLISLAGNLSLFDNTSSSFHVFLQRSKGNWSYIHFKICFKRTTDVQKRGKFCKKQIFGDTELLF